MRWGDKIPYESATLCAAVGNASNAAVAAARLGLTSALRAYVGDDRYGVECLDVLKQEKVLTDYMVTEPGKQTNYHYVLWYGDNRTILVKHEDFTYTVPELSEAPKWVYLSSLAANSQPYHDAIVEWLKKYPESKLAFQPGTFQMKLGVPALKGIYERTDLFVCNKQEAEKILEKPEGSDIKELLQGIKALGPKTVVITDDNRGCYAQDDTNPPFHLPRYPDHTAVLEITGAGDAMASGTAAGLASGLPLQDALRWGSANANGVLHAVGAQAGLLTRETLEKKIANPPEAWEMNVL